ncbi:MAG TPA: cytochrome c [Nitrospinaceae bacterium]|nr:cytochrome c [Nitrospinaceae bacterium]
MPPQRNKLSDSEVAEIIKYIRYSQKAADLVVGEDESDEDEKLDRVEWDRNHDGKPDMIKHK